MNSREAYEAFRQALERARANDASRPEAVARDLPDLEQADLLFAMYFDDSGRPTLKPLLREEACRKLGLVHEREPPTEKPTVYHAMYGLLLSLAREPLTQVSDVPVQAPDRSREDALVREVEALKAKIGELELALEGERAARGDLNAHIQTLIALLESARRPLIQFGDLFSHNDAPVFSGNKVSISFEDVLGAGEVGVKLVEALVEGVKALAEGVRKVAQSERTKKLVSDIVDGTKKLVRNIARRVQGNPDLNRMAESLDEASSDNGATAPRSLEPLAVFNDHLKDGTAGPEMIVIPAGTFMMGSPDSDKEADDREKPAATGNDPAGVCAGACACHVRGIRPVLRGDQSQAAGRRGLGS